MTDQNHKRIPLVWLIVGAVMIITLIYNLPASASGDRIKQENTMTTGDQTFKGDNSKTFAFGAGDVDISGCIAHWSILWGIYTNTRYDWLCIADRYDRVGEHERAAEARCFVRKNKRKYGAQCEAKLKFEYVEPDTNNVVNDGQDFEVTQSDEDDDYHEEIKADMGEFESRVAKLESAKQAPPKVIRKTIQQPFLSDEKKAALRELKE